MIDNIIDGTDNIDDTEWIVFISSLLVSLYDNCLYDELSS
jgi:hypothetical protein